MALYELMNIQAAGDSLHFIVLFCKSGEAFQPLGLSRRKRPRYLTLLTGYASNEDITKADALSKDGVKYHIKNIYANSR